MGPDRCVACYMASQWRRDRRRCARDGLRRVDDIFAASVQAIATGPLPAELFAQAAGHPDTAGTQLGTFHEQTCGPTLWIVRVGASVRTQAPLRALSYRLSEANPRSRTGPRDSPAAPL